MVQDLFYAVLSAVEERRMFRKSLRLSSPHFEELERMIAETCGFPFRDEFRRTYTLRQVHSGVHSFQKPLYLGVMGLEVGMDEEHAPLNVIACVKFRPDVKARNGFAGVMATLSPNGILAGMFDQHDGTPPFGVAYTSPDQPAHTREIIGPLQIREEWERINHSLAWDFAEIMTFLGCRYREYASRPGAPRPYVPSSDPSQRQ